MMPIKLHAGRVQLPPGGASDTNYFFIIFREPRFCGIDTLSRVDVVRSDTISAVTGKKVEIFVCFAFFGLR